MLCNYVTLAGGQQIHYRQTGKGPPLVILHSSPQSSEAMMPAINAFSDICTCFALDTAGYGLSDDIDIENPTMGDYADNLMAALDAIGVQTFCLYGVATGSQIAIEAGKRYPDRIRLLMLDANGHVSDEKRAEILQGYFPDVSPKRDGGHLLTYWDMCRDLFVSFPWNSGKLADQLKMDIPPAAVINDVMLRYLQAGQNYAKAYETAFKAESRDHMNGLNVPATMMRWEGSPVKSMADDLIEIGLPDCVELLHGGLPVEERYSKQKEKLQSAIAQYSFEDLKPKESASLDSASLQRAYFDTDFGQIHAYRNQVEGGKPLVILHGAGASAGQMLGYADSYMNDRLVLIFDLAGHGVSCKLPNEDAPSLQQLAEPILQVMTEQSLSEVDILAEGLGAAMAELIGERASIGQLLKTGPETCSPADRERTISHGLPDITPQLDGSHLVKLWSYLRDDSRYSPWFDHTAAALKPQDADLSPTRLHAKAVDILRTGPKWEKLKLMELDLA